MIEAIRSGTKISDADFDRLFPEPVQKHSETHFTPVEVGLRAASMLVRDADSLILDVGSGAGKFCFLGALSTHAHFHGVEQRPTLVAVAKDIAATHQIERVNFYPGDVKAVDWFEFDGIYLYNPFVENIYSPESRMDDDVTHDRVRYIYHVRWVQAKLDQMPAGTRVVTYHGFGGEMPPDYELAEEVTIGSDALRLWLKARG